LPLGGAGGALYVCVCVCVCVCEGVMHVEKTYAYNYLIELNNFVNGK